MSAADKIKALKAADEVSKKLAGSEKGFYLLGYADARDAAADIAARQDAVMAQMVEAAAELHACHTESAGFSMSMMKDRAEFDAFIQAQQERIERAVGNLGAALRAHKEME